jgi:hypothetical protein
MADDTTYGGWGATAYTPINEWNYVPFYKKNVFTGAGQADQAANLITSPSFTSFWSSGGSQEDNISAVRVTSATRDRDVTALASQGKYNIDSPSPTPPPRPVPPEGIRNIDFKTYYNKEGYYLQGHQQVEIPWELRVENAPNRWSNMNYDWHPDSPYRPATMQGTFPQLTHEEHNWWIKEMRGGEIDPKTGLMSGGWNERYNDYYSARLKHESIPLALRNTAGAMVRDDRQLYSTLRYFTDGSGQGVYRGVNASSPTNLAGLSSELSLYGKGSRFSVPTANPKWQSNILFVSSPSGELAMNTRNSQRVLGLGDTYRLNERAITDTAPYAANTGRPIPEDTGPLLDIAQQEPEAIALTKSNLNEARRVGMIQRDKISGVDKAGKHWQDARPSTTTTVYGPPSKSAQWMARGEQALHIGGKALMVLGGVMEQFNVPERMKGYYTNALQQDPNWRPDPSDKLGMAVWAGLESAMNFGTMGFWDQKDRIATDMTSGAGRGKGFYGTMVPPSGMTSVHSAPDRYERQGVSFNHIYPQAPR